VRPTDENQPASTRPNLISSSRPSGGEDNILAMLERDSGRGPGGDRPRGLWYGAGAGLAVVLVGALVWLASANNDARQDRALADAKQERAQPRAPAAAAPAVTAALGPKEEIVAPAQAAVIIDNPEGSPPRQAQAAPAVAAPAATSASEPPPLVMLTPQEAAGTRPVPAVREAAPVSDTVRAAPQVRQVREQPPVREVTPTHAAPVRVAAVKPAATARPAAPVKPSARPPSVPKPLTAATGRTRKAQGAAAAQHADATIDSDVALISAIISHSSSHAAERAQAEAAGCSGPSPDKKCAARPAKP
jgi:hypothetical protein